jgi:hypothetical protein
MRHPPSPQPPESYGPGQYSPRPYYPRPNEPGPDQAGRYQPGPDQPGPYAPAGAQPARSGRPGLLVPAVMLGVLAVAAIGIALVLGRAATECSSNIGQIAQAFDQQAAGDCSAASTARTVLEIAAPVLALGCIGMIIGYRRR